MTLMTTEWDKVPDEGRIAMLWSKEALREFVTALNQNKVVDHAGRRMTFDIQIAQASIYGTSEAVLMVTLHTAKASS